MQIDIYAREKNGNREIRFPILPEKIVLKRGQASFISYDIMNRGEVAIPSGTGLAAASWESVFPGQNSPEVAMVRGSWKSPESYDKILEDWKEKRTKINLLIVGYPTFNKDVYVDAYECSAGGPFGDISYQLSFLEARDIVITTSKVETTPSTTPPKRTATTSSRYTIKRGDSLWKIARKFYGSGTKWGTIYSANKEIIENTAKKRGYKSSQNGHWIFPGVTLTIPDTSGKV